MKRTILTLCLATIMLLVTVLFASADEVTIPTYVSIYDQTMQLENKNTSTWQPVVDGIGGTLGYNTSGSTFNFGLETTGLSDGDYALIYYADTENRFSDWGGVVAPGIGKVIATGTSTGGNMLISGNVDLGIDLPSLPDANAYFYNYTSSDGYANATGAKIWVVPVGVLSGGNMPVATWVPNNNWLFETNLVNYDDTDIEPVELVAISVNPESIDFGILSPCNNSSRNVVVSNMGYVSTDVSLTIPLSGIFSNISLDWAVATGNISTVETGNSDTATITLSVPCGYIPAGTETGSITFNAVATP
jgi:hypothetical protein